MTSQEYDATFLEQSVPVPIAGCILWTGTTTKNGYGVMRSQYMHRYAWERAHGPLPISAHVLHRCDVPSCVNPAHLFIGTQQDNNADKVRKGRARGGSMKGEAHPSAKLSAADVDAIRKRYALGATQTGLGKEFGISQGTVWGIVNNRNWRHA